MPRGKGPFIKITVKEGVGKVFWENQETPAGAESAGGALYIDLTDATFTGLNIYSNQGAAQASGQPLVRFYADNPFFDQPVVEIISDSDDAPNLRIRGDGKHWDFHSKNNFLYVTVDADGGATPSTVLKLSDPRPAVIGSKSGGAALTNLLAKLDSLFIIDDQTSP